MSAPPAPSSFIGGLAVLAVSEICASCGVLYLKLSAQVEQDRPWWNRPRFAAGFVLLPVIRRTLNLVAYSWLPLTLIAMFAGFNVACTQLLSATGWIIPVGPIGTKEKIGVIVGVGVTSSAMSPASDRTQLNVDFLSARFADPVVLGMLLFLNGLPMLVIAYMSPFGATLRPRLPAARSAPLPFGASRRRCRERRSASAASRSSRPPSR